MFTVVGLGNPGPKYEQTRHNIGQTVIGELTALAGTALQSHRQSNTRAVSVHCGAAGGHAAEQAILAVTNSYMNTSGTPVAALLRYFHCAPETLLVIHDDLDLPFGVLKLKRGGGEGGHNGLRSITQALGTKNYLRLRFGIGRPPGRRDPADFVLSRFTKEEAADLPLLVDRAAHAVEDVLQNGLEQAQMRLHTH